MRGRVSESGGEKWEGAMIQFRIPQNYHQLSRCTPTPHPEHLLSDTQEDPSHNYGSHQYHQCPITCLHILILVLVPLLRPLQTHSFFTC